VIECVRRYDHHGQAKARASAAKAISPTSERSPAKRRLPGAAAEGATDGVAVLTCRGASATGGTGEELGVGVGGGMVIWPPKALRPESAICLQGITARGSLAGPVPPRHSRPEPVRNRHRVQTQDARECTSVRIVPRGRQECCHVPARRPAARDGPVTSRNRRRTAVQRGRHQYPKAHGTALA
jgi:hypothetical protein